MIRSAAHQALLDRIEQDEAFRLANRSQFTRSLRSGMASLAGAGRSFLGATGRLVGAERYAAEQERRADLANARARGMRGAVPTWGEAEGLGDYARIATDLIASNLPLTALTVATAGAGGALGAAGAGLRAASATGLAAETAARSALLKGVARGAFVPYAVASAGGNYDRYRNDPDLTASPWAQAATALTTGAVQAKLGTLPVLGFTSSVARGSRILPTLARTAIAEGVTEALESGVSRAGHALLNPNVNLLDAQARQEYLESGLSGALVGGVYGGAGAALGRVLARPQPPSPTPGTAPPPGSTPPPGASTPPVQAGGSPAPPPLFDAEQARNDPVVRDLLSDEDAPPPWEAPPLESYLNEPGWEGLDDLGGIEAEPAPAGPDAAAPAPPRFLGGRQYASISQWADEDLVVQDATNQTRLVVPRFWGQPARLEQVDAAGEVTSTPVPSGRIWQHLMRTLAKNEAIDPDALMELGWNSRIYNRVPSTSYEAKVDSDGGVAWSVLRDEAAPDRPLMQQYGLQMVALHTDPELASRPVKKGGLSLDRQTWRATVRAIDTLNAQGLVPVGWKDDKLLFASPEDRARFYRDFGLDDRIAEDIGQLARVGVVAARSGKVEQTIGTTRDGQPLRTFTDDDVDGTGIISRAVRGNGLLQGTWLANVPQPDGTVRRVAYKGTFRAPLKITLGDGTVRTEAEGVNAGMQFGEQLPPGAAVQGEIYTTLPDNPDSRARLSYQAVVAGLERAAEFIARDTRRLLRRNRPADLLSGEALAKFRAGTPLSRLLDPMRILDDLKTFRVKGARDILIGTTADLVEPGQVALFPKTRAKLEQRMGLPPGGLQPGMSIVLHREPALPNGSSMALYTYLGEATFDLQDGRPRVSQTGIVVNANDPQVKDAAADFDGDRMVAIAPDELMTPRATDPALAGSYVTKDKTPLAAFSGAADPIAAAILSVSDGLSGRIGETVTQGTKLLEVGRSDPVTNDLIAQVAQGVISAQKKVVKRAELDQLIRHVKAGVRDIRDERGGAPFLTEMMKAVERASRQERATRWSELVDYVSTMQQLNIASPIEQAMYERIQALDTVFQYNQAQLKADKAEVPRGLARRAKAQVEAERAALDPNGQAQYDARVREIVTIDQEIQALNRTLAELDTASSNDRDLDDRADRLRNQILERTSLLELAYRRGYVSPAAFLTNVQPSIALGMVEARDLEAINPGGWYQSVDVAIRDPATTYTETTKTGKTVTRYRYDPAQPRLPFGEYRVVERRPDGSVVVQHLETGQSYPLPVSEATFEAFREFVTEADQFTMDPVPGKVDGESTSAYRDVVLNRTAERPYQPTLQVEQKRDRMTVRGLNARWGQHRITSATVTPEGLALEITRADGVQALATLQPDGRVLLEGDGGTFVLDRETAARRLDPALAESLFGPRGFVTTTLTKGYTLERGKNALERIFVQPELYWAPTTRGALRAKPEVASDLTAGGVPTTTPLAEAPPATMGSSMTTPSAEAPLTAGGSSLTTPLLEEPPGGMGIPTTTPSAAMGIPTTTPSAEMGIPTTTPSAEMGIPTTTPSPTEAPEPAPPRASLGATLAPVAPPTEPDPWFGELPTLQSEWTNAPYFQRVKQAKSTGTLSRLQRSTDRLTKLLMMPNVRIVGIEEALTLTRGRDPAKGDRMAISGSTHGRAFTGEDGARYIYVDSTLSVAEQAAVLGHEMGHQVMWEHFTRAPQDVHQAVLQEYGDWLSSMGVALDPEALSTAFTGLEQPARDYSGIDPTLTMGDVVNQTRSFPMALGTTERLGARLDQPLAGRQDDPRTRDWLDYNTAFNEWFADNVSRALVETAVEPASPVHAFFKRVADEIRRLYQLVREQTGFAPAPTVRDFVHELMRASQQQERERINARRQRARATRAATVGNENVAPGILTPGPESEIPTRDFEAPAPDIQAPAPDIQTPAPDGQTPAPDAQTPPPFTSRRIGSDLDLDAIAQRWAAAHTSGGGASLGRSARAVQVYLRQRVGRDEYQALLRAATAPTMQQRLLRAAGGNVALRTEITNDPHAAAAYLYLMSKSGLVEVGPQTRQRFATLTEALRRDWSEVRGTLNDDRALEAVLEKLYQQDLDAPAPMARPDPLSLPMRQARRRAVQGFSTLYDHAYRRVYQPLMTLPEERLRRSNNVQLRALAGMGGLLEKQWSEFSRWSNELSFLAPLKDNPALHQAVWSHLMRIAPSNDPQVLAMAQQLGGYFERIADYAQGAGLTFDRRRDYFPMLFDQFAIDGRREAFLSVLSRPSYAPYWQQLQARWSAREPQLANLDPESFIMDAINRMIAEGVVDPSNEQSRNPGFRFMNPRELDFLITAGTPQDRADLAPFLEQDVGTVALRYTKSAVRRGEYAKVWGPNGERFEQQLQRALRSGADPNEIQLARDYMDAMHGMYGYRTKQWLNDAIGNAQWLSPEAKDRLRDRSAGVTHKPLQQLEGALITYQNWRLLTTSAFSSFIDPFGVGVRSGSLNLMLKAQRDAFRSLFQGRSPAELERTLELLGTLQQAMQNDDIVQSYYNHQMTPLQTKANDLLFKLNGVEALTRFSRRVATTGAFNFLLHHRALPDADSGRYLAELGLEAGDIQDAAPGVVKILTPEEYQAADATERARDDRVRLAIHRFVDSATIRPGPNNRPLWMNDQHYSVVSHLKGFAFAFHKNVLSRSWSEAQQGNLMPAAIAASVFVPVMLVADWLRDWLKYGEEGAEWKRDWTFEDHLTHAVQRAGLTGKHEVWLDAWDHLAQGDVPWAVVELLGPTASQVRTITKYGLSERDLPTQDLWRHWDRGGTE